ncbi:MAG: pilus (MSHA type) biogenesis protein MshL [Gammaproteobacteria bacterium]|nr:pilus (MSHA type) biogenesis protein MshL [Gammaproteobacteria bacterium]
MTFRSKSLVLICGAILLTACASNGEMKSKRKVLSAIEQSTNVSQAEGSREVELPPEVSQAILPPPSFRPPGVSKPLEERFDLNAEAVDVRELLLGLVDNTSKNIVMHPDVRGAVSLQLKNVTLVEVLQKLKEIYGYDYERDGTMITVFGNTMSSRLFPVNYLNFSRKGKSDVSVSSTGINTGAGAGGAGVELKTETDANFWKEMTETLKAMIGEEEGRRVVANPQAGVVFVRAMPKELRTVEKFLGMTHATLNRQVILEAKILEVELSDHFQSGINWSGLVSQGGATTRTSMVGGGSVPDLAGVSNIAGNTSDLSVTSPTGSTTNAFGGVFSIALRGTNFNAFVELLKNQGNVQVLSSPRVSTVNNQKAVIKVGGDEYFVTGVTNSSSVSGSTTTVTPSVELKPFFSGIALDVTPQIDEWDTINLHIHPAVSEVSQKSKSFVIGDQSFTIPLAFSTVQESDNVVRAQSGQVVVIGGLMKESVVDSEASIPLLGDIPFLGALFKHQRVTRVKKELVILLKPTVLDLNGDQWNRQLEASRNRLRGMGGFAQQ